MHFGRDSAPSEEGEDCWRLGSSTEAQTWSRWTVVQWVLSWQWRWLVVGTTYGQTKARSCSGTLVGKC